MRKMNTDKTSDQNLNTNLNENEQMREKTDQGETNDDRSISDMTENSLSHEDNLHAEKANDQNPPVSKNQVRAISKSLESIKSSLTASGDVDDALHADTFGRFNRYGTVNLDLDQESKKGQTKSTKAKSKLKSGSVARGHKSVKFDSKQPIDFSLNAQDDSKRFGLNLNPAQLPPEFTLNQKPNPFKCDCVRYPTKSSAAEHTCCPKHCPTRHHVSRNKSGNTYVDYGSNRSTSRSSNSVDRGQYKRPSATYTFTVRQPNGRCHYHDNHYSRSSKNLPPSLASKRFDATADGNRHGSFRLNRQLLVEIPKTDERGGDAASDSEDDGSDTSVKRESILRNSSSQCVLKKWQNGLKQTKDTGAKEIDHNNSREKLRDCLEKIHEMLENFSRWNSSLTNSEIEQNSRSREFLALSQPLMDWFSETFDGQLADVESRTNSNETRTKNLKPLRNRDESELANQFSQCVEQIHVKSAFNGDNELSNQNVNVIEAANFRASAHSVQSLSSLSSPSCPSTSSQATSQLTHSEISNNPNETSTLTQNELDTLFEEFNSEMRSKMPDGADLTAQRLIFYEKKIIDLTRQIEEMKSKAKNKQSKKFKIVLRSEYEALKIQLQTFRDDYKMEHAEKAYYAGLCDQYVKRIEELENLVPRRAIGQSGNRTQFQPTPNVSDTPMDFKSFTSIGADLF